MVFKPVQFKHSPESICIQVIIWDFRLRIADCGFVESLRFINFTTPGVIHNKINFVPSKFCVFVIIVFIHIFSAD